jgi:TPR repeat protein
MARKEIKIMRTSSILGCLLAALLLMGIAPQRAQAAAEKSARELSTMSTPDVQALADAGQAKAKLEMAVRYATGNGVAKDEQKALAIAKEMSPHDPQATYLVGAAYATGMGVQKDNAEAMRWLEKAARKNNANAQDALGMMYTDGRSGEPPSWDKAVPWFAKAAAQQQPEAMFMLGLAYQKGRGIKRDPEKAAKWYRLANATQFNAQAQWNLSMMLEKGLVKRQPGDPDLSTKSIQTNAPVRIEDDTP